MNAYACCVARSFAEKVRCVPRDLTKWSEEQKISYSAVAARYQQEAAAYYSLLALGVVGSVKFAQCKRQIAADAEIGKGIML